MQWFLSSPQPRFWHTKHSMDGSHNSMDGSIPLDPSFSTSEILTFCPGQSFVVGAVLCPAGLLQHVWSLFTQIPVAVLPSPSGDNQKCLQILPNVQWGMGEPNHSLVVNHCFESIQDLEDKNNSILLLGIYIFKPQLYKIHTLTLKAW